MRVEVVPAEVTRELRRSVLRPSWPVGSRMSGDDDDDPLALHLAGYLTDADEADVLVGCCLVRPTGYPGTPRPDDWQLRGMATAVGLRGRGFGAAVLAGAVEEVTRRGGGRLWCNARTVALDFYRRAGFTVDGDEFVQTETGLPHHRMSRPLP